MNDSTASALIRYLPVFVSTLFMAVLSGASVIMLNEAVYLCKLEPVLKTEMHGWGLLSLTIALLFLNLMIARGRNWASSWLACYFVVCLMLVVPTLNDRPHSLAFFLGIVFPLLGLLMLNTDLYREMRHKCLEMRIQRAQIRVMYKRFSDNLKAKNRRTRQE
ncbi:hypothetical protein VRB67_12890 [Pseudomonas trivialis]|uniref:hypothetical protein n=1 Tax=Pseudomonas trivialis TaxID=200450 RepID=UPI0030CF4920